MTDPKKLKVTFAPGCFDNFEGTQEELDALIKEIEESILTGEFLNESAELSDEDAVEVIDGGGLEGPVRLACGRTAAWVCIPGVFTRMGAQRCSGCCRALRYPVGVGSPTNVDAIRVILGIPADGGAAP